MADAFFQPISGMDLPRFAGIPTFMRLPHVPVGHAREADVQIGLIGLPWDGGVSNRPGPRHAPRQLRDYSTMIRAQHPVSLIRPFEAANCADLGDVGPNPVDGSDTLDRFERYFAGLKTKGIRPLVAGGDHLCTLPVLRGLAKDAPLGLVHFDSHTDLFPPYFGGKTLTHGNPFRSAVDEGLLDPRRMIQIGIRGPQNTSEGWDYSLGSGMRVMFMEEVVDKGIRETIAGARRVIGFGRTYLSFDIDSLDPAFAPGTGTPETGGFTTREAQQLLRGLSGLDFIGADLVEVSPPFDVGDITSTAGASLLYEILCLLAEAHRQRG